MLQPWSRGAPALSASGLAWDARPVAVELADVAAAGIAACGPTARRLESVPVAELRALLEASGLRLGHAILPAAFTLARAELWEAETARATALVDRVAALGGELLVITAGPPGPLDFEAAAAAFGRAVAPLRDHAARRGVTARSRSATSSATTSASFTRCATRSTSPATAASPSAPTSSGGAASATWRGRSAMAPPTSPWSRSATAP